MNVTNAIFNRESQLWSWVERNCDKCRKGSHPMQGSPCKRTKATCRKAQELYARLDDELRPVMNNVLLEERPYGTALTPRPYPIQQ